MDRNVVDDLLVLKGRVIRGKVLRLKNDVPDHGITLGEAFGHFAPDHAVDDSAFRDLVGRLVKGFYCTPVADDRDSIRNVVDFMQFVRD